MRPDAVLVARTSEGLDHVNALVPYRIEDRLIIIAQGIEGHEHQLDHQQWTFVNYLRRKNLDIEFTNGEAVYLSHVQGVRFTVRIVERKDEFKRYLQTENAHVIYDGHARYGRGPCFGDDPAPGEDWEDGADSAAGGLHRMGFPFITVSVKEILKHGYTANLVRETEPLEPRDDCHPHVRRVSWRGYTLDQLDSTGRLHSQVRQPVAEGERFWGYRGWLDGEGGYHVVLHAGWENTTTHPMDLGATSMQCRVFCHFGCSTLKHNQPIVRERKGWQQTGDQYYAYFTSAPSDERVGRFWLHRILSYPVFNAYEPWSGSLDYAQGKTNQDLNRAYSGYQVR